MLPLDSGHICSTAKCVAWTGLSYGSLCCPGMCLCVCSTAAAVLHLDMSATKPCAAPVQCTCLSSRALVLYLDVLYCRTWTCLNKRACAAPVHMCLFFVLHLWTCLFSVSKNLCCTCTCLPAWAFVLPLDVPFYMKSPCYVWGVRSTTVFFGLFFGNSIVCFGWFLLQEGREREKWKWGVRYNRECAKEENSEKLILEKGRKKKEEGKGKGNKAEESKVKERQWRNAGTRRWEKEIERKRTLCVGKGILEQWRLGTEE